MSSSSPLETFRGTFVDPATEREYLSDNYGEATRSFLRFSVALSSIAFLAYGIHDYLVIPAIHVQAWTIRYGVFLPVALAVLGTMRTFYLTGRRDADQAKTRLPWEA